MVQILAEPNTIKYTNEGNDKKVMYGASCMQGWRSSKGFKTELYKTINIYHKV
jgi:hypothetical protein